MTFRSPRAPTKIVRLSDERLWQLFKSGSRDAFSEIYESNVDSLYNYGMNFTQDHQTVRDCIQDLFVEIWRRRENLGETDNIRYYLLKSLRRKLFAHERQQKKWRFEDIDEKLVFIHLLNRTSFDQHSLSVMEDDEVKKQIMAAVEALPHKQKEALYHIYYENLSYEEAASIMNVKIKTVYNFVWRGVEKLRRDLRKKAADDVG